ncbi:MAG: SDR family NAD(P)-dependent oxidoreductase [Anaerolineae bacterium]|nr:SDR family NAD(P)-dependent oxidoreductase [Anaerolineae bacterium]
MGRFNVDLSGKVVLVTGAGGVIGHAAANILAASGAAVCASDVNPNRVDRAVDAIQNAGGQAIGWVGDMSNRFQAAAMIEAIRDAFGGLDILINAASVDKPGDLLLIDEYDWRRVVEINLTGAFFCTQLAARVMADENGGVIVNVISSPGGDPQPSAAFAAAQAGLVALTQQSAHELAPKGVRVNGLSVAAVTRQPELPDPEPVARGHVTTPHDAAAVVLFLCSQGAASLTGQVLSVDGGYSLP